MPFHRCLLLGLMMAAGCGGSTPPAAGGGPRGPVVVRTVVATHERVERIVELTGTLAGTEEVVVAAEADGRVDRVAADLGDAVKAGALLVQLSPTIARIAETQAAADYAVALARAATDDASLDSASAEAISSVRRARSDADEARRTLGRIEDLFRKSVASQADLDAGRARAETTDAALAAAREEANAAIANAKSRRAGLALARKRVADTSINSPVNGVVAARLVALGEYVRVGQPVARVVMVDPLKMRGDVPERYADAIARDLPVDIEAEAIGVSTRAKVSRIGPLIAAESRTFPIEAQIENPDGRLKPGLFARARVVIGEDEAVIAVPETAVSNVAGITKVFVEEDGKAQERRVQVLRKRGSDALLAGDIKAGDRIIITGVARLFAGADVKVDGGQTTVAGAASGERPGSPAKAPGAADAGSPQ